jgi:two-component system response regulator
MVNTESIVDILLVEDNPSDAELALHALRRNNLANRIEWVKDGEVALDYLFQRGAYLNRNPQLPKVVLLDLRLPKVDGIEVLRAIRENPVTEELPVVVLTSSKEDKDVVSAYKLGVNSFVPKPVAFQSFSKVVAELGMYWVLVNRVPPEIRHDT